MAINRKGMRKIVVDDETYHYKIRTKRTLWDSMLEVVIERPDGEVCYCFLSMMGDDGNYRMVTPRKVKELIKMSAWQEIDGGVCG